MINGIVVVVGFCERVVLLRVNSIESGLNIVDGSSLKYLPCRLDVIGDVDRFSAFATVEVITKHVSHKPFRVVEVDVCAVGEVVGGTFEMTEVADGRLVESRGGSDDGLVGI